MFSFLYSMQENYFYAKFNLKKKDITSKLRKTNCRLRKKWVEFKRNEISQNSIKVDFLKINTYNMRSPNFVRETKFHCKYFDYYTTPVKWHYTFKKRTYILFIKWCFLSSSYIYIPFKHSYKVCINIKSNRAQRMFQFTTTRQIYNSSRITNCFLQSHKSHVNHMIYLHPDIIS